MDNIWYHQCALEEFVDSHIKIHCGFYYKQLQTSSAIQLYAIFLHDKSDKANFLYSSEMVDTHLLGDWQRYQNNLLTVVVVKVECILGNCWENASLHFIVNVYMGVWDGRGGAI